VKRIALAFVAAALAFGGVTLWALEGHEVALLRTITPDGDVRETRVWIAEDDGAWWVEAATPEREFLRDIVDEPTVEVERAGVARRRVAVPELGPAGHERIRGLLRARYGAADVWVGLLTDTSRSVAIRLDAPE
jgi:hypothetical protein